MMLQYGAVKSPHHLNERSQPFLRVHANAVLDYEVKREGRHHNFYEPALRALQSE